MSDAPPEVVALAERRAVARAAKDYAASDALRDEIAALGWLVRDSPEGWSLAEKPPYDLHDHVTDLPDRTADPETHEATVAIVADGWPEDIDRCVASVLAHSAARVLVLDAGLGYAGAADERVEILHLATNPGWAAARTALLKADTARIHVTIDPFLELTGDAITPVVRAFDDPDVVVAGGWGVDVESDWQSFRDGEPGEVDAILGYLLAVRRGAEPPHPKARFYRNADIEWSYALRAGGGKAIQTEPLPATKHRHRGYHDSDPAYRDRESKRTYDRFLQRFRPPR